MDERREWGRPRRSALPRWALGELIDTGQRPDPVTLLQSQTMSRIVELVPIRYGRMLASPFAFFRGAALIMASDLAAGPDTGLTAQLCGDALLYNFGLFGSPERNLVFDINDFDETLSGPWEWDLKRLASSLAVSARGNGFPRGHRTSGPHMRDGLSRANAHACADARAGCSVHPDAHRRRAAGQRQRQGCRRDPARRR